MIFLKYLPKQLVKIFSCSLVILFVLLCCIVPVNAASVSSFKLWDCIEDKDFVDGNWIYDFRVQTSSFCTLVLSNDQFTEGFVSASIDLNPDIEFVNVYYWPFGARLWPGNPASYGVLDVSDLDRFPVFDISAGCFMTCYGSISTNQTHRIQVQSSFRLLYYDGDGNYLGCCEEVKDTEDFTFYNGGERVSLPSSGITLYPSLPDNCIYVAPMFCYTIYPRSYGGSGFVYKVDTGHESFHLYVSVDALAQNSVTLEKIEGKLTDLNEQMGDVNDQLGDLNDKADDLLTGDQHMQEQAGQILDKSQTLDQDIDSAIKDLEEMEDFSSNLAEDQYKDFFTVVDDLKAWLATRPWQDFIYMISPMMEFPPITTILLMLVAFINISILFFGR